MKAETSRTGQAESAKDPAEASAAVQAAAPVEVDGKAQSAVSSPASQEAATVETQSPPVASTTAPVITTADGAETDLILAPPSATPAGERPEGTWRTRIRLRLRNLGLDDRAGRIIL